MPCMRSKQITGKAPKLRQKVRCLHRIENKTISSEVGASSKDKDAQKCPAEYLIISPTFPSTARLIEAVAKTTNPHLAFTPSTKWKCTIVFSTSVLWLLGNDKFIFLPRERSLNKLRFKKMKNNKVLGNLSRYRDIIFFLSPNEVIKVA